MKTRLLHLFILVIIIMVSSPLAAQNESGSFSYYTYAQSLQFQRQYYTSPANYYQYATIVDANGLIHALKVDNYDLYCFTNQRGTDTWTKEKIPTNHDGDIYMAFIGITGNNQRVIVYSYNSYFDYGASTPYGKEFWQSTIIMVETSDGWEEKLYYTPAANSLSNNFAYVPYAINTAPDGKVHVVLHRRGWFTYGGELHEVIIDYNNDLVNWGPMTLIHKYSEGTVDRGTNWIGRQIINEGEKHLVYYKQATSSGTLNLEYTQTINGTWQTPNRIRTTTLGNYHYMDLDTDMDDNYYFLYIENNEPQGPTLWLSKNEIQLNSAYTPFVDGDIATKANLFPLDNGTTNIIVYLKDALPKLFNFDGTELQELNGLTFANSTASELFTSKSFIPIPRFNMLNEEVNVIGFASDNVTTSNSGDITTYPPYDRLFVEITWEGGATFVPSYTNSDIYIYPNPVSEILYVANIMDGEKINIFDISGAKVKSLEYSSQGINISGLANGVYMLQVSNTYIKFVKR